jgi:hypothetical protein
MLLSYAKNAESQNSLGYRSNHSVSTHNIQLFTPQDSVAIDDQLFTREAFPSTQRFITLYVGQEEGKDKNLLPKGKAILADMFTIYAAMTDGTIGTGTNKLADLCIKNGINTCTVSSPLAFWNYDKSVFDADADWIATMSSTTAADCCYVRSTIIPAGVMGGITRDSAQRITQVDAFKMQWIIKQTLVEENGGE